VRNGSGKALLSVVFLLLAATLFAADVAVGPEHTGKLEELADRLKAEGFDEDEVKTIFSDSRIQLYPQILMRSGKGFNYMSRKFGLLTRKSLQEGQTVLRENKAILKNVEAHFGVEKEVIVAILRVETNFGRYVGGYPVFNSLLTLTVMENRRSAWAEQELVYLLRICKDQDRDPLSIKGSWAGAFGICQFIPSSYVKYGVDGDRNGVVDLFSFYDAAASIANYLRSHGWENGDPESKKKAVRAYNHCDSYVQAVLAYAKASKKKG
jgi:membrane-bound lytic murein transglycosylase B